MATITTFVEGDQAHEVVQGRVGYMSKVLDFSVTNASAADVVQALKVKAGTTILSCGTRIKTAEGGTATADLGDASDPNGFGDAVDLNAAAGTIEKALEADAYGIGRHYSSDDTIDLTLDHALDAAVIEVFATYATPALS